MYINECILRFFYFKGPYSPYFSSYSFLCLFYVFSMSFVITYFLGFSFFVSECGLWILDFSFLSFSFFFLGTHKFLYSLFLFIFMLCIPIPFNFSFFQYIFPILRSLTMIFISNVYFNILYYYHLYFNHLCVMKEIKSKYLRLITDSIRSSIC